MLSRVFCSAPSWGTCTRFSGHEGPGRGNPAEVRRETQFPSFWKERLASAVLTTEFLLHGSKSPQLEKRKIRFCFIIDFLRICAPQTRMSGPTGCVHVCLRAWRGVCTEDPRAGGDRPPQPPFASSRRGRLRLRCPYDLRVDSSVAHAYTRVYLFSRGFLETICF